MAIERGQYDAGTAPVAVTSSGSAFLDQLTTSARGARASDIYLNAGVPPMVRAGGELSRVCRARRRSTVARGRHRRVSGSARRVADHRIATFAYGDGAGRVRVSLTATTADPRRPSASSMARPALDRLGLGEVASWLDALG